MSQQPKKNPSWVKLRHRIVFAVFYPVVYLLCQLRYGIQVEKHKEKRQWLILFNHQTPFDQFFPCLMFHGPIYFVSTEDIISKGWISRLLDFLVAPIPIKKQMTDLRAVRNILQVAREGGPIGIAPEGNRTYSGRTCDINPAIAKLAKKIGLPVALVRFEGGYGVHPRWSDVRRKADRFPPMEARVAEIIEPEELKELSDEGLMGRIRRALYQDDYELVQETGQQYYSPKSAEYVERALYVCPSCGLTTFQSDGNTFLCDGCQGEWEMMPDLSIRPMNEYQTQGFISMGDWFDYQQDFIRGLDLHRLPARALYEDKAALYRVNLYKNKELLAEETVVRLFRDRITVDDDVFTFSELEAVSVLGRNKLNLYIDKEVYQVVGDERFNALKYVNFYYRFKNMEKGVMNEQFLGL